VLDRFSDSDSDGDSSSVPSPSPPRRPSPQKKAAIKYNPITSWVDKKKAYSEKSKFKDTHQNWDMVSLIGKSYDDLRQEVFVLQLISYLKDIFADSQLPLLLNPYRIISTSSDTGLIETLLDSKSIDGVKGTPGYTTLRNHFILTHGMPGTPGFARAHSNFVRSLAAYSVVCYLLLVKDRHNGNIMLHNDGSLIHIDFGFLFGIAPGGAFGFEQGIPFKLTPEMLDLIGGKDSPAYTAFVTHFTQGILAANRCAGKIISLVKIMMRNSSYPCFAGKDLEGILEALKDRLQVGKDTSVICEKCIQLVTYSCCNPYTTRYDAFQKWQNGIRP
jgi:phosphatidylinositol 4-kinase